MGELVQSYAPFQLSHFLGLITVSRMFSKGWVPCRGDRYYSRPGVATNIASETHGHSVSFLASASDSDRWSTRRAIEARYRAISLHNIHPTPLEPIESKWSGVGDHVVSKPYVPMRRLASESCFYTREKQEVAFDWRCPAFRLERSRKWLLMGYERKQG
ncbi:hypothetical protein TNCV_4059331 [Trichonephila clavipes]|nr:hypothetical protein TNCV_4059331 [Trichonephila clavipes]